VAEIAAAVHAAGAYFYCDGANLNAIMGKARPGDMGMDVVHMNMHKTFSTPHGGGGPGAGPVAVGELLEPYLPAPLVARRAGRGEGSQAGTREDDGAATRFYLDYDRPQSIGRVKGFYGNVGVLVRAFAYILRMGGDGLTQASEDAVLNANYLRVRLRDRYEVPHDRMSMHEFVASASRQRRRGVTAKDIAKRILDFDVHAPSVYFPLIVPEAMMIEPTETEDLLSLDGFVQILERIDEETKSDPEMVRQAPHTTPVRRPDEVKAAREPILRWRPAGPAAAPPS
jgi:glycine dehydrogenase subunit 2